MYDDFKKSILLISVVYKSKHEICIFLLHLLSTDFVKGEQETSHWLIQPPAASLQILLFFPLFLSFPLRRGNYCPDVKCRIILLAPLSDSRFLLAPWRAKPGFCFHPAPLLLSWCGDEKPQPFVLGAQLTFPAQQLLVCGQDSPSLHFQQHFSGAFWHYLHLPCQ